MSLLFAVLLSSFSLDEVDDIPRSVSNAISTTKYTLLTWLPVSLGEQFKRVANVYFLVISILMLIGQYAPEIFQTPLDPYSTIVTFIFVLGVTCLKEGNEDLKRAKNDTYANEKPVIVITFDETGAAVETEKHTKDIRGGDIIKLQGPTMQVPVDMLLCITSNYDDGNQCYIETANIDGETNLKLKNAPADLQELCQGAGHKHEHHLTRELFAGTIEFEPPNKFIYNFVGAFHNKASGNVNGIPLGPDNVLLRSSLFSNTEWGYGIALYTGQETKIQMNNRRADAKMSGIEKLANKAIMLVFFAQCMLCSITVISVYALGYDDHDSTSTLPYVYPYGNTNKSKLPLWLELWFIFFLLFNNFIPISLYVTIEMINVGQGLLINKDLEIYDEKLNCATQVRSSNLAQELGMVSNIFSDKTGTLTCNEMRFVKFVIDGVMYDVDPTEATSKPTNPLPGTHLPNNPRMYNFLRCLTTCHTVIREKDGTYRAESPDELALVEGAAKLNCSVKERGTVEMQCQMFGEDQKYKVLAINAFNSERKRMSVILKNDKGEYFMMCKGADNIMIPLCKHKDGEQAVIEAQLLDLANLGLRTLCIGQKQLDASVAEKWLADHAKAAASMEGRAAALDACAAEIELGMEMLGITAIEDRLQDEVPEVIAQLAEAGIVVWMLTGDKEETAIMIGRSCYLLLADTKLFMLVGSKNGSGATTPSGKSDEFNNSLKAIYEDIVNHWVEGATLDEPSGYKDDATGQIISIALVMDGPTFGSFKPKNEDQVKWFLHIGKCVRSVIACRLTPNQKQAVVQTVKENSFPKATCLGIGDGANDVSMILEADVGVGIFGKEGRQAANNADFAIGQFKFLRRLLLVHGRWNYVRQSQAFLYSLHKNAVITFMLFWYTYMTSVSGTSPFQSWVYSGYNLVLGLPAVFYGILDRDLSAEFVLKHPQTYSTGKHNVHLSSGSVMSWILNALCYAIILCSMYYYACRDTFETYGIYDFGTIAFTGLVMAMQFKMVFMHHQWAYPQITFMTMSIFGMFFFYWVVQYWTYDTFFGSVSKLYGNPMFWFFGIFTAVAVVGLFEALSFYFNMFFNPTEEMQMRELMHRVGESESDLSASCKKMLCFGRGDGKTTDNDLSQSLVLSAYSAKPEVC